VWKDVARKVVGAENVRAALVWSPAGKRRSESCIGPMRCRAKVRIVAEFRKLPPSDRLPAAVTATGKARGGVPGSLSSRLLATCSRYGF